MNTPVNFEIAKLLKEKGFKSKNPFYDGSGEIVKTPDIPENDYRYTNNEMQQFRFEAPTIADVVMWIYENHNIWISIDRYIDPEQSPDYRYGSCIYYIDPYYGYGHKNPTEAYEAAIEYTLNNLI